MEKNRKKIYVLSEKGLAKGFEKVRWQGEKRDGEEMVRDGPCCARATLGITPGRAGRTYGAPTASNEPNPLRQREQQPATP